MLSTSHIAINANERNATVGIYPQHDQLQHIYLHVAMHKITIYVGSSTLPV